MYPVYPVILSKKQVDAYGVKPQVNKIKDNQEHEGYEE